MSTEQVKKADREMQRRMDDGPAGLSDEALHYYNKWDALHAENARMKAALEEIVSGVYATGTSPRDIAKRVLDGAVPVQMQTGLAKIVINGREMEITTRPLSYEDVVALAGKTDRPTVTWRVPNATGGLSTGEMAPGNFDLVPSSGMVFNVMHTENA